MQVGGAHNDYMLLIRFCYVLRTSVQIINLTDKSTFFNSRKSLSIRFYTYIQRFSPPP
jgi:hypothetical protein